MRALLAIALREFAAFFRSAAGWIICALFALLSAVVFLVGFVPGEPATMRLFFVLAGWLTLLIAPAISMRLLAEERRTGTLETLASAPVSDWAVAFGKALGGWACFLTILTPTLVFVVVLERVADPERGPIVAGYLGLALLGLTLIAMGLFFSSLTRSQVAALLATAFVALLSQAAATLGAQAAGRAGMGWLQQTLYALALAPRMEDFGKGVVDTGHVVFFLATSVWFTSLTAMSLEMRRWR
ncbi:MAG: hypothetical protein D6824_07735 [Planctomycetota bacterium]|nr:MAG: hypothetical protein D6824_07735 [Planctomycetota bacterium]